jgi:ABC-type polar amino acid transport system ATPase subunit
MIESLSRQGMAILLVTNDHRFIAEHATRVLRLEEGRLLEASVDQTVFLASKSTVTEGV